mgnify:CR=1 FL=1
MTLFGLALRSHLGGFAATAFFGLLLGLANTLAFTAEALGLLWLLRRQGVL